MTTTTAGAARGALTAIAVALGITAGAVPASAQCGKASWYALHSRTASGERMNPAAMVAAHRSLPFGTLVQVENLRNGKSVIVRVNDRGPFIRGRVIDVSRGAARQLGFVGAGVTTVRLSVVENGRKRLVGSCG